MKQQTLKTKLKFEGVGLHTGKPTTMELIPAPENTGIIFRRVDLPGNPEVKAILENVSSTNRGTVLTNGEASVSTIEHVLSGLRMMGIDNLYIEMTAEEPPVMDGSALPVVKAVSEVGLTEQNAEREYISVKSKIYMEKQGKRMTYLPSNKFEVTFTLSYTDNIIEPQVVHLVIDEDLYKTRIAQARTFGFESEFEMLKANHLAQGGSLENAVVINNDGSIRNPEGLRDPQELILHKILDLIGDFSLMGGPLKGHIIAERTGHTFNAEFAKKLKEKFMQEKENQNTGTVLIDEIKKTLPHRYPFLLVDRIVSVVPGEYIYGYKNVTANEEFFNGHFPEKPVMPGVLLVEAMAQVAGVLFLSQEEYKGKLPLFCGIDRVRFRKPVTPGDRVDFTIKVLKVRSSTCKVYGEGTVDGELAVSGELMFQLV